MESTLISRKNFLIHKIVQYLRDQTYGIVISESYINNSFNSSEVDPLDNILRIFMGSFT